MSEQKGGAKLRTWAERGATNSPHGTAGITANCTTKCTGPEGAATSKAIASGRASTVTGPGTLARNSRLISEEDLWELTRLRQIRKRGQMLTMGECDWLLELCERWKA